MCQIVYKMAIYIMFYKRATISPQIPVPTLCNMTLGALPLRGGGYISIPEHRFVYIICFGQWAITNVMQAEI